MKNKSITTIYCGVKTAEMIEKAFGEPPKVIINESIENDRSYKITNVKNIEEEIYSPPLTRKQRRKLKLKK